MRQEDGVFTTPAETRGTDFETACFWIVAYGSEEIPNAGFDDRVFVLQEERYSRRDELEKPEGFVENGCEP